eukprot:15233874-Alexandrium_andersonii.AAC.1
MVNSGAGGAHAILRTSGPRTPPCNSAIQVAGKATRLLGVRWARCRLSRRPSALRASAPLA